ATVLTSLAVLIDAAALG
ncbi:hypothetical protein Tco_0614282, partial [Tanacetum coccineum]